MIFKSLQTTMLKFQDKEQINKRGKQMLVRALTLK